MEHDIIIVGGGPAGLSLAAALAGTDLNIAIIERQPEAALADPGYDGREIALTRRSCDILKQLGAWSRFSDQQISPLRSARVLNGDSPLALTFDTSGRAPPLGCLISNHDIRRALFDCVRDQSNVTLLSATSVGGVSATDRRAGVRLSNGETLSARLLVAADSRFSAVRDQLGIGAEMNRLGVAMLVCRIAHERGHEHVATEWFGEPHTIAMLPLNGNVSSAVLTLPIPEAERLAALDDAALGAEIMARYRHRLGAMNVVSSRHVYPLVTTFSARFAIPGAALIGDAAVGMHPVTAHGFNLGVASAARLAGQIRAARRTGRDWSAATVLEAYEREHRRAARPLYAATKFIYSLYGDNRPAARLARHAGIRLARRMPLFRQAVVRRLLKA